MGDKVKWHLEAAQDGLRPFRSECCRGCHAAKAAMGKEETWDQRY